MQIRDSLAARNFQVIDAEGLAAWLKNQIGNRTAYRSVVVFSMDTFPDTVFAHSTANVLIRHCLDAGGRVVWIGDIPFWQRGGRGQQLNSVWKYLPFMSILGIIPVIATASEKVRLTKEATLRGLETPWCGDRPSLPFSTASSWTHKLGVNQVVRWPWRGPLRVNLGQGMELLPLTWSKALVAMPVAEKVIGTQWSAMAMMGFQINMRWTQSVGQNRGHVKSGSCCLKRLQ